MFVYGCRLMHRDPKDFSGVWQDDDYKYIGKAVGNFSEDEWYPGGRLGTTENIQAGCYEDETPAVNNQGLIDDFNLGEMFFERNVTLNTPPFNGLGPASCPHIVHRLSPCIRSR